MCVVLLQAQSVLTSQPSQHSRIRVDSTWTDSFWSCQWKHGSVGKTWLTGKASCLFQGITPSQLANAFPDTDPSPMLENHIFSVVTVDWIFQVFRHCDLCQSFHSDMQVQSPDVICTEILSRSTAKPSWQPPSFEPSMFQAGNTLAGGHIGVQAPFYE